MALRDRVPIFRSRIHLPRRTVRLRLALIYGGLFFVAGVVLLTVTYALVHHSTGNIGVIRRQGGFVVQINVPAGQARFPKPGPTAEQHHVTASKPPFPPPLEVFGKLFDQQRAVVLHQLLVESGVALGVLLLLSVFLGWLMAGRVLRPSCLCIRDCRMK